MSTGGPKAIIFSDKEKVFFYNLYKLASNRHDAASQEKFKSVYGNLKPSQQLRYNAFAKKVLAAEIAKIEAEYDASLNNSAKTLRNSLRAK